MPIVQLTPSFVSTAVCPEGKSRIEYCDQALPGLLLEVRPSQASTYWLRYKSDSHTKYVKLGTSALISLADARKQAKLLKAEIAANGRDPRAEEKARKAVLTLDEFWSDHYLPYATPRKKSIKRDEQIFRIQIQPTFGKVRINQITRQQILTLAAMHHNNGLSDSSTNHVTKLCRRLLSLALQWGMLDKNPASRIELFKENNQIEHYLDDQQLQRFVAVLKTYPCRNVALICMFLLATGCRVSEALTARWSLVDREKRIWRIAASNSKSGKSRTVPLSDVALDVLDQIGTEGKYDHVFTNLDTKKPYTHIRHTWIRIREKAGMPWLRLHDLRHSFASMLVNSGHSLYVVQLALGHSDPRVSARYSHLSAQTLDSAANGVAQKIKEAMKLSDE